MKALPLMRSIVWLAAAGAAFLWAGPAWAAPLRVFVSIPPQVFVAEGVGGDRVEVAVLVPAGQSPHTYAPNPRQMAELSRADILFRIGVPFENALLPKLTSTVPDLRIADARAGIELRVMEAAEEEGDSPHEGHDDEAEDAHDHAGTRDPHVWLDPRNMKTMAATVRDALSELDPAGAAVYAANCARLQADLEALHQRLTRALAPYRGRTLLVFHPAFGYFADAYGLKQRAVEIEGKSPGARRLAGIIRRAREENVRVIFVQPQFSRHAAQTVAEGIDGVVVPMDPLALDYQANLGRMADAVTAALGGGK